MEQKTNIVKQLAHFQAKRIAKRHSLHNPPADSVTPERIYG